MDWQPFYISFKLALVATFFLVLLALPVAYALAFRNFRCKPLAEAFFALPIVLPPTVLGFFVLVAAGNLSPVGRWYNEVFGTTLAFSFEGLVVASVLYSFPFAVQPMQNAFENVDKNLIEAARTLGCSEWRNFLSVILPAGRRGVVTGAMLSFAHTVGEFGVVLMVGGSIPGETKVASIAIYEKVETVQYREAAIMAASLLAFSFAALSFVYYINKKTSVAVVGR
ncbi:MAG TPA: molybdate ABC transporter permease subunit [Thermodesulfobacteriota bacterium]|nr:molybdate ABC transporter permease subunit [Thermodesulfobacteriota bacterium]